MVKEKAKKQFRLYDIYRYSVTGNASNIKGIISYVCNDDASVITIVFEDRAGTAKNGYTKQYRTTNEFDLKQVVRDVNAELHNCMKPGKRSKRGVKYVAL